MMAACAKNKKTPSGIGRLFNTMLRANRDYFAILLMHGGV